jgi:serine/threonine protein kinase/formylglycine-generating enzyme required for sulfatase activity
LNLQADEQLGAIAEWLHKSLCEARSRIVRQLFVLANQHKGWELDDLARRLVLQLRCSVIRHREVDMAENPTADGSWINAAVERFKRAWKNGERPRIEKFLINVPEPQRPLLFQQLMRVAAELPRRAGEEPRAEEYRRRVPRQENTDRAVFETPLSATNAADGAEPVGPIRVGSASRPPAGCPPPELVNHTDYGIVRELGVGGMGVVYLAHNRLLARDEVLKVIGQHIVEQPGVLDRFLREIRAVARLRHPNVVSAYSAFRCGTSLVFAMEYVEGLDLRRMVKAKGPLPIGRACYFVHQAALGLQHAHEEGMVHRDIKPANLMLSHHKNRPVIKVLDFGLSKAVSEQNASELAIRIPSLPIDFAEHLTCTGAMLGTPDFIAPEQIVDSQRADIRADIYSLGCTLYYLLSGDPPYPGRNLHDLLRAHCSLEARALVAVRAEVPAELSMLVARMMAREPAGRFQEPAEIAEALTSFFRKESVTVSGSKPYTSQVGQPAAGGPLDATRPGPLLEGLIDFSESDLLFDTILDTRPEAGTDLLERRKTAVAKQRRLGSWGWWAAAGALLLGLLGAWWAMNLKTKDEVIVLENAPASAVVELGRETRSVRLDSPVASQTAKIHTAREHSPPERPLANESTDVEFGTPSPSSVAAVSSNAEGKLAHGNTEAEGPKVAEAEPAATRSHGPRTPAPPVAAIDGPHPFRLETNGLGGRRFIDAVRFGPDDLGFNKGSANTAPWATNGVFARLTSRGTLGYPQLPVSRYVFEVELTVNKAGDINFQLGDPFQASHVVFRWNPNQEMTECNLVHWNNDTAIFGPARSFPVGTRVNLRVVVGDGWQTLFLEEDRVGSAFAWPADCCLRIRSDNPDSAVIHRCWLRPLTVQDNAACEWPIAPSHLTLNAHETAERLALILARYPARPRSGRRFALKTTNTPMAWIPPGEFVMESRDPKDAGRHRVRLTKGYWMAQIEVTQREYNKLTGANPSRFAGSPYLPVDSVAWDQAAAYCRKLTDLEREAGRLPAGYEYRLPTEAEWEYACRAGSDHDFSVPEEWVWSRDRSGGQPHEVAESQPNPWGLFDMHGNAMEWCIDAWTEHPTSKKEVTVDPVKIGRPDKETTFVVRGGAWWLPADQCTSQWRSPNYNNPNGFRGFRVVLGPEIRAAEVKN